MLNNENDVVFFTGDLVNNQTNEVSDYIDLFQKLKLILAFIQPSVTTTMVITEAGLAKQLNGRTLQIW